MVRRIQFPNADITAVLRFYETLTGKTLLWDNSVQGTVTVEIDKPVSREEAVKILETSFLLNGYSLIPGEGDIVKVVSQAKNPKSAGIAVYSEENQLPATSQVVSYLFRLQYADPQEIATMVQAILGNAMTNYTSVVAMPKAGAVLITESTDVIHGLIKVIAENDIPPVAVVSEFFTLQRADAKDVVEKLEKIFEKSSGQQGAGVGLSEAGIVAGTIKLTADVRTNRIQVIARPINMPFVRKLIQEFDADSVFGEPTVRPLKNLAARDVLGVIVKAIAEPGMKAEEIAASLQSGQSQQHQPQAAAANTSAGANGTDASQGFTEELQTEPKDLTPEAVTVGNTKIIADNRSNAIIVLGSEEVKARVFRVLDLLDVRAYQVMLNTVIGELTLSDNQEVGLDLLVRTGNFLNTGTNGSTSGVPPTAIAGVLNNTSAPLLDPSSLMNAQSFAAAGSGLTAYIAATRSLEAVVKALQATQRFRVTSRPMIFTSNNQKAIIASGQEVAVPVSSLSGVTNNTTAAISTNIEYKKVALQLEVVPLINSDREVSLDILQKIDSLNGSTTVDNNQIPTIQTRYIKTNVSVPDRATVVLGGLITKNYTFNVNSVPYLSRIPVLGWLFKDKMTSKGRSELIILMRPVVITGPEGAYALKRREERRLVLPRNLESTLDPPPKKTPEFHAGMAPRETGDE